MRSRSRAVQRFDLTRHLPHLLRRAHFMAEACFVEVYGGEITSRQLALLLGVAQLAPATQAAVARRIGLDENTCSDLVRRAVARGWLIRTPDPLDARMWRLALSEAGHDLVEQVAVPKAEPYAGRVAERLTAVERERLAGLLQKLLGLHDASP